MTTRTPFRTRPTTGLQGRGRTNTFRNAELSRQGHRLLLRYQSHINHGWPQRVIKSSCIVLFAGVARLDTQVASIWPFPLFLPLIYFISGLLLQRPLSDALLAYLISNFHGLRLRPCGLGGIGQRPPVRLNLQTAAGRASSGPLEHPPTGRSQ